MCVCLCVRARARVRVCVCMPCVYACVYVFVSMSERVHVPAIVVVSVFVCVLCFNVRACVRVGVPQCVRARVRCGHRTATLQPGSRPLMPLHRVTVPLTQWH